MLSFCCPVARLPSNNFGHTIFSTQLDFFDIDTAHFWFQTLLSHGMDLQLARLEPSNMKNDTEFRWIRLILDTDTRFLQLFLLDKIVPGPDKTKVTPLEAVVDKLGYLPFCRPLLAVLDDHYDLVRTYFHCMLLSFFFNSLVPCVAETLDDLALENENSNFFSGSSNCPWLR
jgi:hypothetical protein